MEQEGFSLHAGVSVPGGARRREAYERLCRYVTRPALTTGRLHERPDGRLEYELRQPWSDGTTAVVLQPRALLSRLATLVPPPRAHLLTYHGVLAPASALRAAIELAGTARRLWCGPTPSAPPEQRPARYPWAELLRWVFGLEVLRCPSCGGRRRILAAITQGPVIRAILESLGLPADPPVAASARSPPELSWKGPAE